MQISTTFAKTCQTDSTITANANIALINEVCEHVSIVVSKLNNKTVDYDVGDLFCRKLF